jgi:hypothetical protein
MLGGLLLTLPRAAATQRLAPSFPTAPVEFVTDYQSVDGTIALQSGRCGRSASPVVRGAIGAAAGAAAGYLIFSLYARIISDGGEPLSAKARRDRTRFMIGMAGFGAAFEVLVGPHLCSLPERVPNTRLKLPARVD